MTKTNVSLKRCFPKPALVAYRRNKNLKDELVKAKISSKRKSSRHKKGYSACQQGCKLCWISKKSTSHSCKRTRKTWRINSTINCHTTNVVYKLTCRKCKDFIYIGKTKRRLSTRIAEHRGSITRRNLKHSVGRHFARGHGRSPEAYLEVTGIEQVFPKGKEALLLRRESFWIDQYDSIKFGANTRE